MEYRQGRMGRVFYLRLDNGEDFKAQVEELARAENVRQGMVLALGALASAEMVVGPEKTELPPVPVWDRFGEAHEILGGGTLAWNAGGPVLHLHLSAGRGSEPVKTGCLRATGQVYLVAEAVIMEIEGLSASRRLVESLGLEILSFD